MADRRYATDDEAGQLVRLASGCPPDVPLTGHRREPGQIDPVRTGYEADDELEVAPLTRRDEDQ